MSPLFLLLAAQGNALMNGGFENDLNGWEKEGDVHLDVAAPLEGLASVRLGPGKGAVRQRYAVPGLRILFFGATLKPSSPEAKGEIRFQCFDAHNRLLAEQTAGPDPKTGVAGIYVKTHAFTSYVVLSIEKGSRGGMVAADSAQLQDDDRDRVEHAPTVDLDAYLRPIWQGATVTDESALLFAKGDAPPTGHLLFTPTKILSVRDATLGTEYAEGKDFRIVGKDIVRLRSSNMPWVPESDVPAGEFPWLDLAGKHILVTYTHDDRWTGPTPSYGGEHLPGTMARLTGRKPLTVVALGDSITLGINVSGFRNVPPYMPPWPTLFAEGLKKRYRDAGVRLYNVALGGQTAQWGADNANTAVASLHPDLVLIAFGMNDFWSYNPEQFGGYIKATMAAIRAKRPRCEFILISSMEFDPAYTADPAYVGHLAGYADVLRGLSGPGVGFFDMTALSDALYKAKSPKDLLSDPMHPADFLARWYAQGLVAMLDRPSPQ